MTGPAVFEFLRSMASPTLDRIVKVLTDLGSTSFYMIVIPIIYWCINKSLGFALGMVSSVSAYINVGLKLVFKVTRPYVAYPELGAPEFLTRTGTGWSFPSGHAQGTSTFWSTIALKVKRRWLTVFSAIIVAVVMFTRVYATVHWPVDVLVGAVLGLVVAFLYTRIEQAAARSAVLNTPSVGVKLALAVAAPMVLFSLSSMSHDLVMDTCELIGFMLGLGAGYVLETEYVHYDVRAKLPVQIVKIAVGLLTLIGIRYGLKAVFPDGSAFWTMIRYAAMGLWGSLGAPFVFKALLSSRS